MPPCENIFRGREPANVDGQLIEKLVRSFGSYMYPDCTRGTLHVIHVDGGDIFDFNFSYGDISSFSGISDSHNPNYTYIHTHIYIYILLLLLLIH